ncbi:hypothetical protein [Enterococcus gilvus]|uniref:hypothetical protein n=1 Tax=Enterococcus gilvus TaxID=160453 RepID=UPI001C8C7748|nr:hypothetical protein [Enterococcus gilvus]MBX8938918.1 hypothetical protein [Enterococcus gilvus]
MENVDKEYLDERSKFDSVQSVNFSALPGLLYGSVVNPKIGEDTIQSSDQMLEELRKIKPTPKFEKVHREVQRLTQN